MIKNLILAETLNDFMLMHGVSIKEVCFFSDSGLRSVMRWKKYGIPKNKWNLLNFRYAQKKKEDYENR
jgi:hypothetical protein